MRGASRLFRDIILDRDLKSGGRVSIERSLALDIGRD